jgi:hypothetical protein
MNMKLMSTLPEPVKAFLAAMIENGKKVWAPTETGFCFAEEIPYVAVNEDGSVEISDNFERFFNWTYAYSPTGEWTIDGKPYSYEEAMADAGMMFTG